MTDSVDPMTDESLTLEEGIRIPGVMVRGRPPLVRKLPPKLYPLRDLLVAQTGDDRAVIDDWIEEQTSNVVHDLWMLTIPTEPQRRNTLMVIGRGTKPTHYAGPQHSGPHGIERIRYAIAEAQRQLTIHPHARWVRLIEDNAQASPQGEEVLMDHVYFGGPVRRRLRRSGSPAPRGPRMVRFRSRCLMPGCVVESIGTQVVEVDELTTNTKGNIYVNGEKIPCLHVEITTTVEDVGDEDQDESE